MLFRKVGDSMETEHLILRNWQEGDASELYEMCLDSDLRKSGIHFFNSIAESHKTIEAWMKNNNFKAIVNKADGCLVGLISLGDMNRYDSYMELEYAIVPRYRNKGYAYEALNYMIDYGFKEQNISVIAAWVRSHNKASIRVLEKCLFTFEGRLRKHARDKSDTLCFSILREEWEQLQLE